MEDLFADAYVENFILRKIAQAFVDGIHTHASTLFLCRLTRATPSQWVKARIGHRAEEEALARRGRQVLTQLVPDILAQLEIRDAGVGRDLDAFTSNEVTAELLAAIDGGSSITRLVERTGLWPPRVIGPTALSSCIPIYASIAASNLVDQVRRDRLNTDLGTILKMLLPSVIPSLVSEFAMREVDAGDNVQGKHNVENAKECVESTDDSTSNNSVVCVGIPLGRVPQPIIAGTFDPFAPYFGHQLQRNFSSSPCVHKIGTTKSSISNKVLYNQLSGLVCTQILWQSTTRGKIRQHLRSGTHA
ncbi:hypothetical protein MIND_00451800 [Mycena indigotica]|uniref:Uncharacterized protein n=1 Tax=Mycena indigotica TaxID=2126181 RepID=A0A8H6SUV4_9AGAR|nr:uncharacterized protein MIND_00451800 [Mycena indigotica]KAF7306605.1 hypothetical protein MIND_00451800 [Mycena indigotica]